MHNGSMVEQKFAHITTVCCMILAPLQTGSAAEGKLITFGRSLMPAGLTGMGY
jgi:hypothetical protein